MARRRKKRSKGGFRRKARALGGRARRGARRFRARKARMGIIGKAGIGLAGGIPLAFAAIEAIAPWTDASWATALLSTKIRGSLGAFTNTLTQGFGAGETITQAAIKQADPFLLPAAQVTGANYVGAWFKTTAAGLSLVVIDGVIGVITRVAAGGRVRPKIMGRQLISG